MLKYAVEAAASVMSKVKRVIDYCQWGVGNSRLSENPWAVGFLRDWRL